MLHQSVLLEAQQDSVLQPAIGVTAQVYTYYVATNLIEHPISQGVAVPVQHPSRAGCRSRTGAGAERGRSQLQLSYSQMGSSLK